MLIMKNRQPWITTFALCLAALALASCGGGSDPAAPPDDNSEIVPPDYEISNPQPGHVYNWAGYGLPGRGEMGRPPKSTQLYWPQDVTFDPEGQPVVLDFNNHRVIRLNKYGRFDRIIGGTFGSPFDGLAKEIQLNHPTNVNFGPNGKMILTCWHNSILMEMDMTTGWIQRYCGASDFGRCYNGDNIPRLNACLDLPVCTAYGPDGNLYVGDQANQVIRRIDANGIITTYAGTAPTIDSGPPATMTYHYGYGGDGGPAASAMLHFEVGQAANPSGRICFDPAGNLFIADTSNHAIRKVDTSGIITTYAGMGPTNGGYAGDGGLATGAKLYEPRDVACDATGNIFVADTGNHVIRMVATDGIITTVAGVQREYSALPIGRTALAAEHGAEATTVRFTTPMGVVVDPNGNVWISDTQGDAIRILYR
jgi:hypothetical protein